MQRLEDVLFSIMNYMAMKPRNSYLILNHVSYLKKVKLYPDLNMLRRMNIKHIYLSVEESMLFM